MVWTHWCVNQGPSQTQSHSSLESQEALLFEQVNPGALHKQTRTSCPSFLNASPQARCSGTPFSIHQSSRDWTMVTIGTIIAGNDRTMVHLKSWKGRKALPDHKRSFFLPSSPWTLRSIHHARSRTWQDLKRRKIARSDCLDRVPYRLTAIAFRASFERWIRCRETCLMICTYCGRAPTQKMRSGGRQRKNRCCLTFWNAGWNGYFCLMLRRSLSLLSEMKAMMIDITI